MDAAAWLVEFARRERVWRDARQAFWDGLSARSAQSSSNVGKPVVLEVGHEVDAGSDRVPMSARRVVAGALAAGWSARVVASLAAVPASGVVSVATVRCRRRDERLWAAWRNGTFDVAWYVGPTGLEQVGAARMSTLAKLAATRAAKAGTAPKPVTTRGLMDVIEGIRGAKQWVNLLERQEQDRAVGVLAAAFPGLCLTRQ